MYGESVCDCEKAIEEVVTRTKTEAKAMDVVMVMVCVLVMVVWVHGRRVFGSGYR